MTCNKCSACQQKTGSICNFTVFLGPGLVLDSPGWFYRAQGRFFGVRRRNRAGIERTSRSRGGGGGAHLCEMSDPTTLCCTSDCEMNDPTTHFHTSEGEISNATALLHTSERGHNKPNHRSGTRSPAQGPPPGRHKVPPPGTGSAQGLHKAWVVSQKVLASQEGFSISGWSAKDLTKLLTSQGGFSISGNFLTSHAIVNILYVLYHDVFSTCAAISCLQAVEGL